MLVSLIFRLGDSDGKLTLLKVLVVALLIRPLEKALVTADYQAAARINRCSGLLGDFCEPKAQRDVPELAAWRAFPTTIPGRIAPSAGTP